MTYFKFNIDKVNNAQESFNKAKTSLVTESNSIFSGMQNADSAWNDYNSAIFVEKVKKDKAEFNNYIDYLNDLFKKTVDFKNNIEKVCNKYGYRNLTGEIYFDDSELGTIYTNLDDCINLINSSINYLNPYNFPSDFTNITYVRQVIYNLKGIKESLTNLKDSIKSIAKAFNDEIINSNKEIKKLSGKKLKLNKSSYTWTTRNIDTKALGNIDTSYESNISTSTISNLSTEEISPMQKNTINVAQSGTINYQNNNDATMSQNNINQASDISINDLKEKDLYMNYREQQIAEDKTMNELSYNGLNMNQKKTIEVDDKVLEIKQNDLNMSKNAEQNVSESTVQTASQNINMGSYNSQGASEAAVQIGQQNVNMSSVNNNVNTSNSFINTGNIKG